MRNKLWLLPILFFGFFTATAQTEQGRFMLSGQTNASAMFGKSTLIVDSVRGAKTTVRNVNANLGFAWFAIDNLAIGVSGSVAYSYAKESSYPFHFNQQYVFGVIPGATYYFPVNEKFKPTLSAGAGYVWIYSSKMDVSGLSLNAAPGFSYFANEHLSADLGIQYSYNNLKNRSDWSGTDYRQHALGLLAGISVYF